jgi:hypothetical protein
MNAMRILIQYATFLLVIAIIVVLSLMAWRKVINWRYIVLPFLVMVQLLAFYVFVFITTPPPSEITTNWSAIIRLETYAAFLIVLVLYWKNHNASIK